MKKYDHIKSHVSFSIIPNSMTITTVQIQTYCTSIKDKPYLNLKDPKYPQIGFNYNYNENG